MLQLKNNAQPPQQYKQINSKNVVYIALSYNVLSILLEIFTSTTNYPKPIAPAQTSNAIHQYTSIGYSRSKHKIYPTQSDGLGSVPISTSTFTPTSTILIVALGILIIPMVLGIIGVVIVCRKNQLNRSEGRQGKMIIINYTYLAYDMYMCDTGTNERIMQETCLPEPLVQKNPAYYQGTILSTSSSNQAHDYETPVVFLAEDYIVMSSHEYDVPRLQEYQSHDYEEV